MKTERRAVARYKDKVAVQVEMDEYEFDAESMEVSLLGMRVVCDGGVTSSLFNKYIKVTPGENVAATLQIKIPQINIPRSRGLVNTIAAKARVISVSRISQSSYVVGFNIIEFHDEAQELWENYISTKH